MNSTSVATIKSQFGSHISEPKLKPLEDIASMQEGTKICEQMLAAMKHQDLPCTIRVSVRGLGGGVYSTSHLLAKNFLEGSISANNKEIAELQSALEAQTNI
jgi:hypothetical protein